MFKKWASFLLIFISSDLISIFCHDSKDIVPTVYDIVLDVDFENMLFNGNTRIGFRTFSDREHKLKIGYRKLNITSVELFLGGKYSLRVKEKLNREHELLEISQNLGAGDHYISISFQGHIVENTNGFFKMKCRSNDILSWIAGATLEPISARSIFPAFDISEVRTPVNLTLILNQDLTVVTSHATTITKLENRRQEVSMKCDDVHIRNIGWVIYPSDGKIKNSITKDGHKVITCRNHWELMSKIPLVEMAMKTYTGDTLKDLQWIMLPNLVLPVSTSNNLIFVREHLMEQSDYSSANDLSENQMELVEGYAQQWFGHTIAADSWSDLWLTKGLTKFFKYKIAGKIDPVFDSEGHIVGRVMPRILDREIISHSTSKHVDSTKDVLSMYDQDLFEKAGLIMRMLEDVIGEENFRKAVETFVAQVTENNNGANLTKYFWQSLIANSDKFPREESISLSDKNDKRIDDILEYWIRSAKYPIVHATRSSGKIHITQKNVDKISHGKNQHWWWIPISVTSQSMRIPKKFWLGPNGVLSVNIPHQDEWYMINENSKGFYRVNYNLENWVNLSNAVRANELDCIARPKLIDDVLGLAEQNVLPYYIALGFTRHLEYELESMDLWAAATRHLEIIRSLLESSPKHKNIWDKYTARLITGYLLGINSTTLNSTIDWSMDTTAADYSMLYKHLQTHKLCRNNSYCSEMLDRIPLLDYENITTDRWYSYGDLLDGILCYNVENKFNGTEDIKYLNLYNQYTSPSLERKIIRGLACTHNSTKLLSYFTMFLLNDLKDQDFAEFVSEIAYSEEVIVQLLDNSAINFKTFLNYFSGNPSVFSEMLLPISEKVYTEKNDSEINAIVIMIKTSGLMTYSFYWDQINRSFKRMELNSMRRAKFLPSITSWLDKESYLGPDFFPASSATGLYSITLCILSVFILLSMILLA